MVRWVCSVKARDGVGSDSLLAGLGVRGLDVVLRTGRMRWFGRVERRAGWVSIMCGLGVVAQRGSGRPGGSLGGGWQKEAGCGLCWPSGSL